MIVPADRPLEGIRVVDLTSNIAAPFGGAVLADLSANVTHVEELCGSPHLSGEESFDVVTGGRRPRALCPERELHNVRAIFIF